MAPCQLISDTRRSDGFFTFRYSRQGNLNESPYSRRMEKHGWSRSLEFLTFGCISAVTLYSYDWLSKNHISPIIPSASYHHRFLFAWIGLAYVTWFLPLVLSTFYIYLRRLLYRNYRYRSRFRSMRRLKFFLIRNLARFIQLLAVTLTFFYHFSLALFRGLSFIFRLRAFSLLHTFSTLPACPSLFTKLCWSPSEWFYHYMFQSSDESIELCLSHLTHGEKDALRLQALIEVDSRSATYKDEQLVLHICRSVRDLKLASAMKESRSGFWYSDFPGELFVVSQVIRQEQELNDSESSALVSKLWLEEHVGRFPCLMAEWAASHCESMELLYDKVLRHGSYGLDSFSSLHGKGPFPLEVNIHILKLAQKALADRRYYRGSFEIIHDLIFHSDGRDVLIEDWRVQEGILHVFQEVENFLGRDVEFRSYHGRVCAKELEDFSHRISYQTDNVFLASPFYEKVVSFGNSVLPLARGSLP